MTAFYYLASLLLPAMATVFFGYWGKRTLKGALVTLIATEIAVNGLVLLAQARWGDAWTHYEYLLGNAVLSVTVSQLVARIALKRRISCLESLKAVCFICASVAVYSALTYGQTQISSDAATATLISQSQIAHRSMFPASWNYANGDIWTVGNSTFTLPFMLLLRDQSLARMLGSASYALVSAMGMWLISKRVFKDHSWLLGMPLFLVFMAGGEIYFILYEAAYTGQMLFMTLGFVLVYGAVHTRKAGYAVLYALMAAVLSIGGMRFVAEQSMPLLGAYVALWYIEEREHKDIPWGRRIGSLAALSALVMVPVVIGLAVNRWLASWHNLNNTVLNSMVLVESVDACWNNLVASLLNLFKCFGYAGGASTLSIAGFGSLVSIAITALVCFIVPALQLVRFKSESRETQLFFLFGMLHNAIIIMMAAIFGLTTPRYMLTPAFVCIVLSSRYIYAHWIVQGNFRRSMWTGLFALAAAVECLALVASGLNWHDTVVARKGYMQALVDDGLTKGYATYWNAYDNQVYSDLRIRFGAVNIGQAAIARFPWLVDGDVFAPSEGETFLLLNEPERQVLEPDIPAMFGAPERVLEVGGCHVYVFDHDIVTDFDRSGADGVLRPIEMNGNENVSREGGTLALAPGGSVESMPVALAAGEYLVTFEGEGLDGCALEIASPEKPGALAYSDPMQTDGGLEIRLSLSEKVKDLAFSVSNGAEGESPTLSAIRLTQVATDG